MSQCQRLRTNLAGWTMMQSVSSASQLTHKVNITAGFELKGQLLTVNSSNFDFDNTIISIIVNRVQQK